jgi:hypothetical protein
MSPNKLKIKTKVLNRYIICALRRAHMLKFHIFQVTMIRKTSKRATWHWGDTIACTVSVLQYTDFPPITQHFRSGWFVENRNWVYIWSTVHAHKRCPADIQTTTHGYVTCCSTTAQPPVLSANNILLPPSPHLSFIPARKISTRVECIKRLLKTASVCNR